MPLSVRFALPVLAVLVLLLPPRAEALPAMDCFECHDSAAFEKSVKHEPAAPGECGVCHSSHAARYEGLLQQKVRRLCSSCHPDAASGHEQGLTHQPVRNGECLACHDPHASEHTGLLKKSASEICFDCHTEMPRKFAFTHAPYGDGECSSCHRAHQSDQAYLLTEEPEALCLDCHDRSEVTQAHPNAPVEVTQCGSCHSPHGSDRPGLVRNVLHEPYREGCSDCHDSSGAAVTVGTCLQCHDAISEQMASSHNHLVRYGDNSCMACHSPHAGDEERLLKGSERHVCGACHEGTFARMEKAKFRHVQTASCTDCHAPHGSNHPAMVKGPIISVCVTCHTKHEEFTHPIGAAVFDPRTGQMMTCASCHATKGTEYADHLRFSGKRDLCLQCHREY